jgi:hypothetical protein
MRRSGPVPLLALQLAVTTVSAHDQRLRWLAPFSKEEVALIREAVLRGWLNDETDDPLAYLTVAEVAQQLQRSPGTVREWIRCGELERANSE